MMTLRSMCPPHRLKRLQRVEGKRRVSQAASLEARWQGPDARTRNGHELERKQRNFAQSPNGVSSVHVNKPQRVRRFRRAHRLDRETRDDVELLTLVGPSGLFPSAELAYRNFRRLDRHRGFEVNQLALLEGLSKVPLADPIENKFKIAAHPCTLTFLKLRVALVRRTNLVKKIEPPFAPICRSAVSHRQNTPMRSRSVHGSEQNSRCREVFCAQLPNRLPYGPVGVFTANIPRQAALPPQVTTSALLRVFPASAAPTQIVSRFITASPRTSVGKIGTVAVKPLSTVSVMHVTSWSIPVPNASLANMRDPCRGYQSSPHHRAARPSGCSASRSTPSTIKNRMMSSPSLTPRRSWIARADHGESWAAVRRRSLKGPDFSVMSAISDPRLTCSLYECLTGFLRISPALHDSEERVDRLLSLWSPPHGEGRIQCLCSFKRRMDFAGTISAWDLDSDRLLPTTSDHSAHPLGGSMQRSAGDRNLSRTGAAQAPTTDSGSGRAMKEAECDFSKAKRALIAA